MVKRYGLVFTIFLLGLLLTSLACRLQAEPAQPSLRSPSGLIVSPAPSPLVTPTQPPNLDPTPMAPPATQEIVVPTATVAPDLGWQVLSPGLERRWINLLTSEGGVQESLYVLRIDPAMYDFDVGYKPGAPQRLMDWQSETGALIVVNGGFFTADGQATGLIIVDGQAAGTSYAGFGGMLAIDFKDHITSNKIMQMMQDMDIGYLAVSLGYFKTLFSCSGHSTSSEVPEEIQKEIGLTPGLTRFSVGLDNDIERTCEKILYCLKELRVIS